MNLAINFSETQAAIGRIRPRLYTREEAADELDLGVGEVARLIRVHGLKPTFPVRPYKYQLNDFREAINREKDSVVYKIEKNIPLPPAHISVVRAEMEAKLKALNVGDSMLVPSKEQITLSIVAKRLGISLASRKTHDEKLRRIWRLE